MDLGQVQKWIAAAATGLLAFAVAAPALAGTLDPSQSFMVVKIGGLAPLVIPAQNDSGSLDPGSKTINLAASVFATSYTFFPKTIPTSVPTPSLLVSAVNGAAIYTTGFAVTNAVGTGTLLGGGQAAMAGRAIAIIGGSVGIPIDLLVVGQGGTTTTTALGSPATITGAAWGTNSVQITGIASNVLAITNGSRAGLQGIAFTLEPTANENVMTVTVMFGMGGMLTHVFTRTHAFVTGSRNTAGGVGTVTLISPIRILTGLGIRLPGLTTQILTFVPEPGTLLLLGSGAGVLAAAGSRRRRKYLGLRDR